MSLPREDLPRALTLTHEAFRLMLGGRLLNAPVNEPVSRVLDIGTGCGIWAVDFADEHPSADVIGMDVFPQSNMVAPANCQFIERDAEKDWDLGEAKFDIIHLRLVPFHRSEVPVLLRRCYEHLKPGGFIEMHESCPPCRTDEPPGSPDHASKVIEWTVLRAEATAKLGIVQSISGHMPDAIGEAGFVEVQTQAHKWPIGPWMEEDKMKHLGNINVELLGLAMRGLSTDLLSNSGMSESQVDDFIIQVKKDLGVGKVYGPVQITWAKKPI